MAIARTLTVLWFLVTLVVLAWPGSELPQTDVPHLDKLVHAAIFTLGTILALRGWPGRRTWVVVVLLVFAPLAEVWQAVMPTERDANLLDAIANSIGVGIGLLISNFFRGKGRRSGDQS
jgi:VanZ family protein